MFSLNIVVEKNRKQEKAEIGTEKNPLANLDLKISLR